MRDEWLITLLEILLFPDLAMLQKTLQEAVMNAGIDIGYNGLKAVAEGGRKISFPSVVGTPERSRFGLNGHNKGIVLKDKGSQWLIGDLALHSSRFATRREDPHWYASDDYRRLMLAAFSQITTGTSVRMTVVTGLPIAYYDAGKAELKDIFEREHRVEIEGRSAQRIEVINCRVVMQPVGTVLHLAMDDAGRVVNKEVADKAHGVIDIGGKTTNMLTVHQLAEVPSETDSVDKGAWDIMRAVRDFFSQRGYFDLLDLSDHEIMAAILEGKVDYFDSTIDLNPVVGNLMDTMADAIFAKSTHIWGGSGRLKSIIITGGGAYLLGSRLLKHFKQARIAPDPQFANALGYAKFAAFLERSVERTN